MSKSVPWFDFRNCETDGEPGSVWSDGSPREEGQYVNGCREDLWTYYYNGGIRKLREGYYLLGQRVGIWTFWHSKVGQAWNCKKGDIKMAEGGYTDGLMSGLWTFWDSFGRKIRDVTYLNGAMTGPATYYHIESSEVSSSGSYLNSKKTGPWTEFFKTRRDHTGRGDHRSAHGSYTEGVKTGPWTSWTRDGTPTHSLV